MPNGLMSINYPNLMFSMALLFKVNYEFDNQAQFKFLLVFKRSFFLNYLNLEMCFYFRYFLLGNVFFDRNYIYDKICHF